MITIPDIYKSELILAIIISMKMILLNLPYTILERAL